METDIRKKGISEMKSTVLCYNLKDTKKGKKVTMIFGYLGYRVRHVEKKEYLKPIGILVGMDEEKEVSADYEGAGFDTEMLVMNAATEEMLDKALFLMRKEGVKVDLKAMVTPNNRSWTSLELQEEIAKEHRYMTEKNREQE